MFLERHAQTQAGRATAVLHALLEVEDLDLADRPITAGQLLQVAPDIGIVTALFRHDQQHAAIRASQQLAVEQVGLDRILHRHRITRHTHGLEVAATAGELVAQLSQYLVSVEEGVLVIEQHLAIAYRDHVVVKHTLVDHRRRLLGVDHALIA